MGLVGPDLCLVLIVLAEDELFFRDDQKQSLFIKQYHLPEVSVTEIEVFHETGD